MASLLQSAYDLGKKLVQGKNYKIPDILTPKSRGALQAANRNPAINSNLAGLARQNPQLLATPQVNAPILSRTVAGAANLARSAAQSPIVKRTNQFSNQLASNLMGQGLQRDLNATFNNPLSKYPYGVLSGLSSANPLRGVIDPFAKRADVAVQPYEGDVGFTVSKIAGAAIPTMALYGGAYQAAKGLPLLGKLAVGAENLATKGGLPALGAKALTAYAIGDPFVGAARGASEAFGAGKRKFGDLLTGAGSGVASELTYPVQALSNIPKMAQVMLNPKYSANDREMAALGLGLSALAFIPLLSKSKMLKIIPDDMKPHLETVKAIDDAAHLSLGNSGYEKLVKLSETNPTAYVNGLLDTGLAKVMNDIEAGKSNADPASLAKFLNDVGGKFVDNLETAKGEDVGGLLGGANRYQAQIDKLNNLAKAERGIPVKSTTDLDALKAEARKYKTAEEFVNSQGLRFNYETAGGEKRIIIDLFPKETIKGKGITTSETLNAFRNAYVRGTSIVEPSNGIWTKDGWGFIKKLEKDGFVKQIDNRGGIVRFEITPKVGGLTDGSQLTSLWNEANAGKIDRTQLTGKQLSTPSARLEAPGGVVGDNFVISKLQKQKKVAPQAQIPEPKLLEGPTHASYADPEKKLGNIEARTYGAPTSNAADLGVVGKTGAGKVSNTLRNVAERGSLVVGKMLESDNMAIRNTGRLLQGFSSGLGRTASDVKGKMEYRGGTEYATLLARDVQKHAYDLIGNDKVSLERVHAVLDPEINTLGTKMADLTPAEKELTSYLRMVSDYINDTNYKNGFISEETWYKGKDGKYIARAYEPYDFPPEVADFMKQSKGKLDLGQFTQRKEVTEWMQNEAVKDPVYLTAKRLQQSMYNDEVSKYAHQLAQTEYVSKTPKPGFVQVSDHKAWGELAGQYIRKDVMQDVKGFYFESENVQKLYDALNWYDRNPVRRGYKELLTIFNPAVRLGNRTGNYVFAWLNGINPIDFAKRMGWAKAQIESTTPIYRQMLQDGTLRSGAWKDEIQGMALKLKKGAPSEGLTTKVQDVVDNFRKGYGDVDDQAKLAAMKTWLDRGYSYEEATRRVVSGFQTYVNVGWLYDLGAKVPVFGNPFVRFQNDLMRIVKNAAIDHPFRTAGTLMAVKLFTDVMSVASGETPEDRKVREARVGAPHIPFTNISLAVQTPWGEVNAARLVGLAAYAPIGWADVLSDTSRLAPFRSPFIQRGGENYLDFSGAPDIGPLLQAGITDRDFRGKKISDPNANQYTGSTLTPGEQNMNRLNFLRRSYTPTIVNAGEDLLNAAQGKEDYYGRNLSTTQAALRLYPGVKVEQYGPAEAQKSRETNLRYGVTGLDSITRQMSSVKNEFGRGEITEKQATQRLNYLQNQYNEAATKLGASTSGGTTPVTSDPKVRAALFEAGTSPYEMIGGKLYYRSGEDVKNIDISKLAKLPANATMLQKLSVSEDAKTAAKNIILNSQIFDPSSTISPKVAYTLLKQLGQEPRLAYYSAINSLDTENKAPVIMDLIKRAPRQARMKLLWELIDNEVLTAAVNKELAAQDLISLDAYDALANFIKKRNAAPKKAKAKKLKVPKSVYNSKTVKMPTLKPVKLSTFRLKSLT